MKGQKSNIYRDELGVYYYSSHREMPSDVKIDSFVSTEYAFAYCNKMNFENRFDLPSRKADRRGLRLVNGRARKKEVPKAFRDIQDIFVASMT